MRYNFKDTSGKEHTIEFNNLDMKDTITATENPMGFVRNRLEQFMLTTEGILLNLNNVLTITKIEPNVE